MNKFTRLDKLDIRQKTLLIREDFNVPLSGGVISDFSRIERALPTIRYALKQQAAVILCSHLGRPKEGEYDPACTLQPVADALSERLSLPVPLYGHFDQAGDVQPGQVALLENVRFNVGEGENDPQLARKMAALCDIFVMDAFATAHRSAASTVGVVQYANRACCGLLMLQELDALDQALGQPREPVMAIVGGAKVSTKIQLLESLLQKVDVLIVGGGIANTFLRAQGLPIGQSLYEPDYLDLAKSIYQKAQDQGVTIPLPVDVRVATEFDVDAQAAVKTVDQVQEAELILDIGPKTQQRYHECIQRMQTVVWNGPVGVFEFPAFAFGTQALGASIARSNAFSIAGGGDTLLALARFNLAEEISYASTGGGAFLTYLEGETLPALVALQEKETQHVR